MKETQNEKIIYLLKDAHIQTKRLMKNKDQSHSNIRTLKVILNHFPDGARPSDIAKHDRISLPSVSQKLSLLEDEGLITREYTKNDRRVTIIKVTQKGQILIENDYKNNVKAFGKAIESISKKEKKELIYLLEKVSESIDEYLKEETE